MCRATSKVDLPTAQLDEKEGIQRFQEESLHREKIASQDLVFIMTHQMPPAWGIASFRCWRNPVPSKDVAYRFVAKVVAQLGQFASDLGIRPIGILARQPDNQSFEICGCTW